MSIRCLIIDDEVSARNILNRYISEINGICVVAECKNAIEALAILEKEVIDVIFLDIEMPKISGLAFLKTLNSPPNVIVTTAFREYAIEGYEHNVIDFLLKPIPFERFLTAVNKVISKKEAQAKRESEYTYFKTGKKNIQVYFNEILFIEGLGNYVKIHTENSIITTYDRMSDMEQNLPKSNFSRIHRSYIVALDKVKAYGPDYVEIGMHQLSVGNTYRELFYSRLSEISDKKN